MTRPVQLHVEGQSARIVFDRPEALNAIDRNTAQQFEAAVHRCLGAGVRVLTIAGNGRSFMAGGDLAAFRRSKDPAAEAEAIIQPMNRALLGLSQSDMISIALLHGPVAGAGLSIAVATDFALAADTAVLSFAYLRIGAPADCGITWNLPRIVGLRRAAWIAIEGSTVPAAQALDWGLVNRVVPQADLLNEGEKLAGRLALLAPGAVASLRGLLRDSFQHDLPQALEAEKQAFKAAARTQDFAEAIQAFFKKQPARFTGQ